MTGVLLDAGTMDYKEAWDLQLELMEKRTLDQVPDTLILLEHNHVITLGRKTSDANFKPQKSVPVYQVERGGDATYHGPGQLVAYPIIKLLDHDVRRHVRIIEDALINTVVRFGVDGIRVEGHPGIWVDGKQKLASIGITVTNWVAYHGLALNVNTDLAYFELIRPCGLDPGTMTSMQKLLGTTLSMEDVKHVLVDEFARASGESFEPRSIARPPNLNVK